MGELEQELKFVLPDRKAWQRALDVLGPAEQVFEQTNYYFSDGHGSSGWSLRVRLENGYHILTYKSGRSRQEGYFQALEVEHPLEPDQASRLLGGSDWQPALWSLPPLQRLRADRGVERLYCLGFSRNQRHSCPQGDWVAELDISEFPDGSVDYELEVECSDPAAVRERLQELLGELTVQTATKYRRFLERRPL